LVLEPEGEEDRLEDEPEERQDLSWREVDAALFEGVFSVLEKGKEGEGAGSSAGRGRLRLARWWFAFGVVVCSSRREFVVTGEVIVGGEVLLEEEAESEEAEKVAERPEETGELCRCWW
jgi:hypothetical protein